jgi:hypothetical protein
MTGNCAFTIAVARNFIEQEEIADVICKEKNAPPT